MGLPEEFGNIETLQANTEADRSLKLLNRTSCALGMDRDKDKVRVQKNPNSRNQRIDSHSKHK